MDTEKFFQKLLQFDKYELVGRNYYRTYGHNLSYSQFLYLLKHSDLRDPLFILNTASAKVEQAELQQFFKVTYNTHGLLEKDFIRQDRNVDINQLPRYIDIPKHKHDFFELVCILSSKCTHLIDSHRYTHHAGDFVIIPPGIEHELHAKPDCVCLTNKIRSSNFSETFSNIIRENSVFSSYFTQILHTPHYQSALTIHCGDDKFFRDTILLIYSQQMQGNIYCETIIESLWLAIFSYILQNYQDTAEFLVSDTIQHTKMFEILNYIHENYQYITLNETARHFYCSTPYLSTKIRKMTGKTFTELIKTYKLHRATELLLQTDMKLDLICDEIGYKDSAQFIRTFKKYYKITPVQYRKANMNGLS